jgi:hypothetical protein
MEISSKSHVPAKLTPGSNHGTHLSGGWVGPREGLVMFGDEKIFIQPGFEIRVLHPIV